jgi:hypothetical protein
MVNFSEIRMSKREL